jgi:PEP-CTERM motif
MFGMRIRAALLAAPMVVFAVAGSPQAFATTLYSQGFEADTAGWPSSPTRVSSGTNGITSASGSWHAEAGTNYTNWGGYDSTTGGFPGAFEPYTTSLDIYLDVNAGFANDTRFDFVSAINKPDGTHLRDFAFNGGFYNSSDATGPGAGTNRFVIATGNNSTRSGAYPKDPGHDPIAISTSGWYTFQEDFFDNAGALGVTMNILDSGGGFVYSWLLGGDPISGVGGNRYGWFPQNEFPFLAIDNASLTTTPLPATLPMFASGLGVLGLLRWRRKRKSVAAAV